MVSEDIPSRYVMLENHGRSVRPPPYRRNIPQYHSYHRPKGSKCGRCFCCFCCCIFIFILLVVAVFLSLFLFFKPQMPSYNVDSIHVSAFAIRATYKLYTEFNVVVKANNPNSDIGLQYGKGSAVNIIYSGSQICSGQIPAFVQRGKNTTKINMVLKGQTDFGSPIQHELIQNQKAIKIPLLIKVKVPVTVVLHGIQLREFVVHVNCSLIIDNLKPGKDVKILSSQYSYEFHF